MITMQSWMTVPTGHVVALVDVRCMYVSVERVFDPSLWSKAVVVLSNNDGVAIARSAESRALGVQMGQPWFEIRKNPRLRDVIARSSNYELYGDFSARMVALLRELVEHVQEYSVDESFVLLGAATAVSQAQLIQQTMARGLGLPVTIGAGPTKTLAKVASLHAKNSPAGIVEVGTMSAQGIDELLAEMPVGAIWGVGRRLPDKLARIGIHTAYDLKSAEPQQIRRLFSVVLERTVLELRGVPCIEFYDEPASRHQLIYSRLFGSAISDPAEMRSALTAYAATLGRRLRRKGLQASTLTVSLATSWHSDGPAHHPHTSYGFLEPTDSTEHLAAAATPVAAHMLPGVRYARATLVLTGLTETASTPGLYPLERSAVSDVLDAVHDRFGAGALDFGHGGLRAPASWSMRRKMLSPRFSTRWSDLLPVQ